ncbi:MAG: transglutaminase TgpA family protein [Planctomycetota bacterium]|jgi:transglutaminase-like putative cysteine protease
MTNIFHVSIYLLIAVSSMMLTIAEEAAFPTGLTIPAALLAWFLNEQRRSIRLKTWVANVLGVVAFLLAGTEVLYAQLEQTGFAQERRVLAGAHLLSYLTWIALFQAKQGRQYWWLLALSVMQVAVGSILTDSSTFGSLMLVFVFLALWTLSVFSLYQARFSFEHASSESGDVALQDATVVRRKRRGPVTDTAVAFAHHRPNEFQGAIQLDPNERWVNGRFVGGVVTTSLLSIGVGMVFFILIPRLWVGERYEFEDDADSALMNFTGFTDEVQLGELGQILESNRPVMQVRCYRGGDSGEELRVDQASAMLGFSEPMFRGSVMGRYSNGRWHVLEESQTVAPLLPPRPGRNRIRQHIILHDSNTRTLFGLHPVIGTSFEKGLIRPRIDVATMMLMKDDDDADADADSDVEYSLYSTAGRRGFSSPVLLEYRDVESQAIRNRIAPKFLELPDDLTRLRELAGQLDQQVSRFEQSDLSVDERIAYHIEDYLRNNPDFAYSLSADIVDGSIDPVEDFLFNRRSGHCEYYASAMALMLRAVGIPSRLISGFKGGEQNEYSGAFVVEERHAHAWVEARVNRRWRTFDPTPASRAESVEEVGSERSVFDALSGTFTMLWQQRVVRLSIDEQQNSIYTPLAEVLKAVARNLSSIFGGDSRRIIEFLTNPRRWFSIPTFIGTAVLIAVLAGLKSLWRRFVPESVGLRDWLAILRRIFRRLLSPDHTARRVEFYERFARVLAAHGLKRTLSQTPSEFAGMATIELQSRLAGAQLDGFPDNLASLFYRVRFGRQPLTSAEASELNSLLTRLEAALDRRAVQTQQDHNP